MKHLLSGEGVAALVAAMGKRPLLAFDFDGTLAPIVARPDDAKVPVAVVNRLRRLSAQLSVAIISGRRVDDVRKRLEFEPAYVIGNHGAEDPFSACDDTVQALDAIRRHLLAAEAELTKAGVQLEDKGSSLALHYRLARDRQLASTLIDNALRGLPPGLSAFGGKLVTNVVVDAAHNKAQALAVLVERCQSDSAIFVGDDVNDEPVFARGEPSWLTVRVGRDDPASKAQFFLDSGIELPLMLDLMVASLPQVP